MEGSSALMDSTMGRIFFSSRSFCVPKTFARMVSSMNRRGRRTAWLSSDCTMGSLGAQVHGLLRNNGRTDPCAGRIRAKTQTPDPQKPGNLARPIDEELQRIELAAVDEDFVVQMVAGRAAGGAREADEVTALDAIAAPDGES